MPDRRKRLSAGILFLLIVLFWLPLQAVGAGEVLVLEFDLKDMTLAPEVKAEAERVRTLQPLLAEQLSGVHGLQILANPESARAASELGAGYVFDHPAVAVQLGQEVDARWVVPGRLYKPTHLFVYLKAQLIDVEQARVAGDFSVEIKGAQKKLTQRGVAALALQIAAAIASLQ